MRLSVSGIATAVAVPMRHTAAVAAKAHENESVSTSKPAISGPAKAPRSDDIWKTAMAGPPRPWTTSPTTAVLLVPILVISGVEARVAAPLGLVLVAALTQIAGVLGFLLAPEAVFAHIADDVTDVVVHTSPMPEVLVHHRDRWGHVEDLPRQEPTLAGHR